MYQAEILADSLSPSDVRLTTMRVVMPRFILAEFNTHRVFSRNAGSSRAISISKRLEQIRTDPVYPLEWGKNQKGMQASELVETWKAIAAIGVWEKAAQAAYDAAMELDNLGVHKQIVNRLLEPFAWVAVIVSATKWNNFWKLRHPDFTTLAQPEMMETARVMKAAMDQSTPQPLTFGEWHLPTMTREDIQRFEEIGTSEDCCRCAVGRLARVSYETEGKSFSEDITLAERLGQSGHWSPFEHVAQVSELNRHEDTYRCRNFGWPWVQYRALVGG